jgi:hypothetical protein
VLTDEEARIERAIDSLGSRERDIAPAEIGDRVFAASVAALRDTRAGSARVSIRHPAATERARGGRARRARARGLALIAGAAAIACGAVVWLAFRPLAGDSGDPAGPGPALAGREGGTEQGIGDDVARGPGHVASAHDSVHEEVEALFAASTMLDTGLDDEIAAIRLDAASLGLDLADPLAGGLGVTMTDSPGDSWRGGPL